MNPEIEQLKREVQELKAQIQMLYSSATIPYEVDSAFRDRFLNGGLPTGFGSAPLPSVTAPSGGATIDTAARTAINAVITRMEDLGLIELN